MLLADAVRMSAMDFAGAGLGNEEDYLSNIQKDAESRGNEHKDCEYGLLRGTRNKTIDSVGAGIGIALNKTDHGVTGVDEVEEVHKCCLKYDSEENTNDVGPPQGAGDLDFVFLHFCQLLVLHMAGHT